MILRGWKRPSRRFNEGRCLTKKKNDRRHLKERPNLHKKEESRMGCDRRTCSRWRIDRVGGPDPTYKECRAEKKKKRSKEECPKKVI